MLSRLSRHMIVNPGEARMVGQIDDAPALATFDLDSNTVLIAWNPIRHTAGMARIHDEEIVKRFLKDMLGPSVTDSRSEIVVSLVMGRDTPVGRAQLEELASWIDAVDSGRKLIRTKSRPLPGNPHPVAVRISAIDGRIVEPVKK